MIEDDGSTRVMTLNMWHNDVEVFARLEAAAKEILERKPEVVILQEVLQRSSDGMNMAVELSILTGIPLRAVVSVCPTKTPGNYSGLAILSSLEPLERPHVIPLPTFDPKNVPEAALTTMLRTHSGRPLIVATAHLAWGGTGEYMRLQQVVALDAALSVYAEKYPGAVTILGGDFNTSSDAESMRYLKGLSVADNKSTFWVDAWDVCGDGPGITSGPGNPWAAQTAFGAGILDPSLLPDRRIDYILVKGYVYGRPGYPFASRVAFSFPAASDHWGVEVDLWDPPFNL